MNAYISTFKDFSIQSTVKTVGYMRSLVKHNDFIVYTTVFTLSIAYTFLDAIAQMCNAYICIINCCFLLLNICVC